MPNQELTPGQIELAKTIWEIGAFKVGAFKLKLHETHPEAPLSPYYISMREKDVAEGTFPRLTMAMARAIHDQTEHLTHPVDYVLGIPRAGDPIAESYYSLTNTPQLTMVKIETADSRRISSQINEEFKPGSSVLGVDDLITAADTKLEFMEGVRANGLVLAHLAVGLDREQGGMKKLEDAGQDASTVWKISDLLEYYRENDDLDLATFDTIRAYIAAQK